ncbi:MAG TPA: hypothetical protein VIR78_02605 [Malonomonas sp.]
MKEVTVVYQDGMMDMVAQNALQSLIETDEIVKFQRTDGWVYPGVDQTRCMTSSDYQGPERRTL